MTFSLTINSARFRDHLQKVLKTHVDSGASVIPVIKGNGYGFGRSLLANESSNLGATKVCVGTIWEASEVLENFSGEVIVLEPISETDELALSQWQTLLADEGDRLVPVVATSKLPNLADIGVQRVWLELRTSMNRFGLTLSEVASLSERLTKVNVIGYSLHLPIAQSVLNKLLKFETVAQQSSSNKVREVCGLISWLTDLHAKAEGKLNLMVSHLTKTEIAAIAKQHPDIALSIRLGTSLWLGDSQSVQATGTVLAVHELGTADRVGYLQTSGGKVVAVVSGGTAHGVALAAPIPTTSWRRRGIAVAEGFAQALGKVRSPFSINGKNLNFVEPPHMQVSMLWADGIDLKVGDEISCNVRNTTANFDAVIWN